MADSVSKMSAFTTNVTFSHTSTSSNNLSLLDNLTRNIDILTKDTIYCKHFFAFFRFSAERNCQKLYLVPSGLPLHIHTLLQIFIFSIYDLYRIGITAKVVWMKNPNKVLVSFFQCKYAVDTRKEVPGTTL